MSASTITLGQTLTARIPFGTGRITGEVIEVSASGLSLRLAYGTSSVVVMAYDVIR